MAAGNKEFAEIGNDLLSQIASDDQDHQELDTGTNDDGSDDQSNDKFQNEFEDDGGDDQHEGDDLGSDKSRKEARQERTPTQQQQPTKPTGVVEDIYDPAIRLKQDRAGNLLNSAGQIVVRAGRERKFFEDAKKRVVAEVTMNTRLAKNMQQIAGAAKELHARYQTLQQSKGMFDQAGLNSDEQLQMLNIATEFKKNPVDGIKKMLTMAHMQGVDLKTLGVAGGIDARTIAEEVKRTVSDQLKPITERETANRADREALEQARNTAEEFFQRNPDALAAQQEMGAENFNKIIFDAKRRFPDMTLTEIWLRIKVAAANGGPVQTQGRGQQRNDRRATEVVDRRPQRRPTRTTGTESFSDIGRSVLRDLQTTLRE